MINPQLQKKIDGSIGLLQSVQRAHKGEYIEIAYSGGKDSDVILQLAKEAGINYRAIYKNTTIDPRGTLQHVRAMGVEVVHPKRTFLDIIKAKGFPNRQRRFCCSEIKEYKIMDICVMGIRREESCKRAKMYKEPTECRKYSKGRVEAVYPILDWTLEDVREFIINRGIQLAPVYYDERGELHADRRLGCIGCPLATKEQRLAELKQYPTLVSAMCKAAEEFLDTHPNSAAVQQYGYKNGYDYLARNLFFETQEEYNNTATGGMFGRSEAVDFQKAIEKYFNIKL